MAHSNCQLNCTFQVILLSYILTWWWPSHMTDIDVVRYAAKWNRKYWIEAQRRAVDFMTIWWSKLRRRLRCLSLSLLTMTVWTLDSAKHWSTETDCWSTTRPGMIGLRIIMMMITPPSWHVLKFIFQRLKILSDILHTYAAFEIYAKLQSFVQLSLTLTKLCL